MTNDVIENHEELASMVDVDQIIATVLHSRRLLYTRMVDSRFQTGRSTKIDLVRCYLEVLVEYKRVRLLYHLSMTDYPTGGEPKHRTHTAPASLPSSYTQDSPVLKGRMR